MAMAKTTVGRIVQKLDFERMLAVPARQRSAHFALHHLPERPAPRQVPARLASKQAGGAQAAAVACPSVVAPASAQPVTKLSTGDAPLCTQPVDDLPLQQHWLGTVVPKRHAKRAVTRNLVKRQCHHQFSALCSKLPAGLWVLRLKAPFGRDLFPSARSEALAAEVRTELGALLQRAAQPRPAVHGR